MTFMHILFKRFSSAGLKDALIQSAVVAEGSVEMALKGKIYNRGMRLYKLFYEAIQRMLIERLAEKTADCAELALPNEDKTFNKAVYNHLLESEEFKVAHDHFLDLKRNLNTSLFALPKFWLSFIEMVELLLNTIYACRAGKWVLLLECICDIIPYAFAYDHINYARYLTVMLGDMLSLKNEFPDVQNECISGKFAAQLSDNAFSRIETDKVIEMTINKDTKTPGGTTGFSTNIGAVKRWEINASYRVSLRRIFSPASKLRVSNSSTQRSELFKNTTRRK